MGRGRPIILGESMTELTPTLLPLVYYPDERLKKVAAPVTEFNDELNQLVVNMFHTMKTNNGIGLAASQVGVSKSVIVLQIDQPLVLINPMVLWTEGKHSTEEGCLSVPGYYESVNRAETVRVVYQDETGANKDTTATGLLATCIQHEIDHLNGILFVDHLSKLKQMRARVKVSKTLKQQRIKR
jgi:peptide deformylase